MGRLLRTLPGLAAACLPVLLWGCARPRPAGPAPWEERHLTPLSSSLIYRGEHLLGRLREYEYPDPARPVRLWLVENEHGQWVGWIDGAGRAFRLAAHERRARPVATGSLALCAQVLFGLEGPPCLIPEGEAP